MPKLSFRSISVSLETYSQIEHMWRASMGDRYHSIVKRLTLKEVFSLIVTDAYEDFLAHGDECKLIKNIQGRRIE